MENNQKEIKNYWNILKEELSKNKRAILLFFLFIIIFVLAFWGTFASNSATENLKMMIPFVVGLLALILAIPIVVASRKRYEHAIVGKNPWEIAGINFRRYAKGLLAMFVIFVLLNTWFFSLSYFGVKLLAVAFVYVVASILFLVVASLFKRKSPKAIAVGYVCLLPLLIIAVYLFSNSFFEPFFEHKSSTYWLFWYILSSNLIHGILDIRKASKYVTNIKKDSEFQKVVQEEIIKVKAEEK